MKEVIDLADGGEFSEFSKKVKQSLNDKMRNHPKVQAATQKFKDLESMKGKFAEISAEPEDITDVVDVIDDNIDDNTED